MNNVTSFVKKHTILTVIAGIVAGLLGWWAIVTFIPHPLGEKMEYIGKKDYGNILGFDYRPYSVYYYGTDLAKEDLAGYFDAELRRPIEDKGDYTDIDLTRNGQDFYVTYEKFSDFKTSKKYIILITNEQYDVIKKQTQL